MYQRRMNQLKNNLSKQKGENAEVGDNMSNASGHRSCNAFTLRMRMIASL